MIHDGWAPFAGSSKRQKIGSARRRACRLCSLPADISRPPANGPSVLQCSALDRNANWRAFCAMEEPRHWSRTSGVLQALSNLAVTSATHVSRRRNPRRSRGTIHRVADRRKRNGPGKASDASTRSTSEWISLVQMPQLVGVPHHIDCRDLSVLDFEARSSKVHHRPRA